MRHIGTVMGLISSLAAAGSEPHCAHPSSQLLYRNDVGFYGEGHLVSDW